MIKYDRWFPRFIIFRRLRNEDDQINIDQQQLMVKQIGYHLKEEMTVMNQRFDGTETQFKSSINSSNDDLSVKIDDVNAQMQTLKSDVTEGIANLKSLIEKLQEQLPKNEVKPAE